MERCQNLTKSQMQERTWKHSQRNRRFDCREQLVGRPNSKEQHLSLLGAFNRIDVAMLALIQRCLKGSQIEAAVSSILNEGLWIFKGFP